MKKIVLILIISFFSTMMFAQRIEISEYELQNKLDSVLIEGNLLYHFEKAARTASDFAVASKIIKKDYSDYIVYPDGDNIKVIFFDKKSGNCLAEYTFLNDFSKPDYSKTEKRPLTDQEKNQIEVKNSIITSIADVKYGVTVFKDYKPRYILFPFSQGYKMYIINETSDKEDIPFGNDFLFVTNEKGEITGWQKFHSRAIPADASYDEDKVTEISHSHIKTTPLITATDICIFMLYAPTFKVDSFTIYSQAIGKYMEYNMKENKIYVK